MADIGDPKQRNIADAVSESSSADLEKSKETLRKKRRAEEKKADEERIKAYFSKFKDADKRYSEYKLSQEADKARKQAQEDHELRMKLLKDRANYAKNAGDRFNANMELAARNAAEFLKGAAVSAYNTAVASVNEYANLLSKYQSSISARTQGANTFQDMYDLIKKNVGASPWVKQTAVLENLSKLVSEGIAYNVEQRAFLNTIKDEIATTFDAANGTLLQLIRIQQADTTAARLGMEAYLTRFLNATFQDTSYLNQGYDTTSAALLAMSSSAGSAKQAAELEFVAQKWLGSLAAVGVSDSTLQMLAQGIGALGSGDVNALAGNSAMQALFAMASGRGGLGYGELLTGGFTADKLNTLLESIVTYGQSIASTTNAVVRNQYAQLFGMSVSDLRALQNLDVATRSRVSGTTLSYNEMIGELGYQYSQIGDRLHISEMVQNVLDNTLASIGAGIANNPVKYVTWIVNDLIEAATGGINIPTVGVLGNFVGLNANLNQLLKVGLMGGELMGTIATTLGGLFSGSDMLDRWGLRNTNIVSRGRTEVALGESVTGLKSQSQYVGNKELSDIYQQTVTAAETEAQQEAVTGEKPDIEKAILENIDPNILAILTILRDAVSGISPIVVTTRKDGSW